MSTPCRHTIELRDYELAEAKAEREWENQAEERRERLDQEIDRVMNEISAGDHDSDLIESPLLDASTVMKVARERAQNARLTFGRECDLGAINNLNLQIAEYARDLAERRMLR